MPSHVPKMRVNAMSVAVFIERDDGKHDVVFEENVIGGNLEEVLDGVRSEVGQYEVRPTFEYFAQTAIEMDPHGPEGLRHTMDQIQDWFHRRYVHPFAPLCKNCGQVRAKHGPSHHCKQFKEE